MLNYYKNKYLESYQNMTNKKTSFFPSDTLNYMIEKLKNYSSSKLPEDIKKHDFIIKQFKNIISFRDIDKKNRWFGYYQRYGESCGYWTLEEIIEKIRDEKSKFLEMNEPARIRKMLQEEAKKCKKLDEF